MTVAVLEHLGHTAVAVGRATEALEVLLRGQQFDLVFSDVVMPGDMDGIQLAHQIRRCYPTLPILLVTGYSVKLASSTASPCGVDILRKPYSVNALQHAIAESLTVQGSVEVLSGFGETAWGFGRTALNAPHRGS